MKAYDGISRSSPTESIAKCALNFIDSRYPHQNSPLPIYAMCPAFQPPLGVTSGTHFMESFVGQSGSVPDLQGHPGNDGFVTAISFTETS